MNFSYAKLTFKKALIEIFKLKASENFDLELKKNYAGFFIWIRKQA